MDETFDTDAPDLDQALRVVIAYDEIGAGRRAMDVLADVAKRLGNDIEFQPLPWSFDLLADLDWREVAASEAINADILIISTSSANPLPPAVGRWAEAAISEKQGTHAAVVALFGSEENPDGLGSSRLEAIQTAAQRAGLDFFAPTPRRDLDEAIAHVHQRAEMVSPLLDQILQHSRPEPRWEQNA
jgi:hypothetical protein